MSIAHKYRTLSELKYSTRCSTYIDYAVQEITETFEAIDQSPSDSNEFISRVSILVLLLYTIEKRRRM